MIVDQHRAADDIRCAAESRLPEAEGENHDGTAAGSAIVRLFQDAAQRGADAEHREIAAGHNLGLDRLGVARRGEVYVDFGAAEHAFEKSRLLLEFAAERIRHEVPTAEAADNVLALPIDE